MEQKIELIHGWFKEDFPQYADILFDICLFRFDDLENKNNLFLTHINLATDYFDRDRNKFSRESTEILVSMYLYLTTSLICLDAIVDGHSIGKNETLTQSDIAKLLILLQTGGLIRLRKFGSLAGLDLDKIETKVISLFYKNALALDQEEKNQHKVNNVDVSSDYENIIQRSYIALFAFELVALTCGQELSSQFLNILKEIIYSEQFLDDIGDWKIDFLGERYTPFLQKCLANFEQNIPSLTQLEEFVYLSGAYESQLAKIIMRFDAITNELNALGSTDTLLMQDVKKQRKKTKEWLVTFINEKTCFMEEVK